MSEIFCDLNAIPAEKRPRHAGLWGELRQKAQGVEELGTGYAIHFSADSEVVMLLAEWMTLERLCCPFFTFELRLTVESLQLSLTGEEGVKALLAGELGIKTN